LPAFLWKQGAVLEDVSNQTDGGCDQTIRLLNCRIQMLEQQLGERDERIQDLESLDHGDFSSFLPVRVCATNLECNHPVLGQSIGRSRTPMPYLAGLFWLFRRDMPSVNHRGPF
jgi:hypothetical protein